MIGYRIEPVEGFNAISMHTPPVYDAPFGCRKANDLRGLGVLNGSLDIDFQGVDDGDCAVMLRPGDAVDVERFVADYLLLALAACKDSKGDDED